jgi:drug/metabolite transporter (DMT)-like permease
MNSASTTTTRGFWFVLAAAVCWGTTGTAQAFAPEGATPLAVGAMRLLIGGSALLLFALGRRQLHWRGWPPAATATAIGTIAGYQTLFLCGGGAHRCGGRHGGCHRQRAGARRADGPAAVG